MPLRPKTRRLILLCSAVGLIVGGVAFWAVWGPSARASREATAHRAAAQAAYAAGDYPTALERYSQYFTLAKVDQNPTDEQLDGMMQMADSRRRIPRPAAAHLIEAAEQTQRVLRSRPTDARARRQMMEILAKLGRRPDAAAAVKNYPPVADLAEQVLADAPGDRAAMVVRATALLRQEKPDLVRCRKLIEPLVSSDPKDYRSRRLEAWLAAAEGQARKAATDAAALAEQAPPDPGMLLAAAAAHREAAFNRATDVPEAERFGFADKAHDLTARAAAAYAGQGDADLAADIVEACDREELFPASIDVLRKATAKPAADREFEWALVRKLWQVGATDEVLARTAARKPADRAADAELLGYRGLALVTRAEAAAPGAERTTPLNDVDVIATGLAARKGDDDAQFWAALLRADAQRVQTDLRPPAARAEVLKRYRGLREAFKNKPHERNVVLLARLGDAAADLGDNLAGTMYWGQAAAAAADWGYPRRRVARVMYGGFPLEAERWAADAAERAPDDRAAGGLLLACRWVSRTVAPADLLADVDRHLARWPNDADVVPLGVVLTAIAKDPAVAAARVDAALAAAPPLPADALVELLIADRARRLGRDATLAEALGKLSGGQARLLAWQAQQRLDDGKPAEALAAMEKARAASGSPDDAEWKAKAAAFRERAGDTAAAAKAWAAVADENPTDVRLLAQVLASPAARADRDLLKRVADRIKAATGDEGLLWRTAEAQWLRSGPAPTAEARRQSTDQLDVVAKAIRVWSDPYVWLGEALKADGRPGPARQPLNEALKLRGLGDPYLALLGVEALRDDNAPADARRLLNQVASIKTLTGPHRLWAALLMEQFDDRAGAIRLLVAGQPGAARDAALARLYAATGQHADAAAAYDRVLNDAAATPADLLTGESYHAGRGATDKAKPFLDRLRAADLPEAERASMLAKFEEAHGSRAEAVAQFVRATEIAPKDPGPWVALAGAHLRGADWPAAEKAVAAGLAAAGPDARLLAIQSALAAARALPTPGDASTTLAALGEDPLAPAAAPLLAALRVAQTELRAAPDPAARRAALARYGDVVVALAKANPTFWPAQEAAVTALLGTDKPAEAAALAAAAADRFPGRPAPARMAAEAFARTGTWDRVIEFARKWRDRDRGRTSALPADVLIARAQTAMRNRQSVERVLDPHVRGNPIPPPPAAPATVPTTASTTGPSGDRPAVLVGVDPLLLDAHLLHARALIELGRAPEAAEELAPLLAHGEAGVALWLSLTPSHDKQQAARQWVARAATATPTEAGPAARTRLADAWLTAGQRTGDADMFRSAVALTGPLVAADRPSIDALYVHATASHHLGDYDGAAKAWRAALAQRDNPGFANNLAYVLLVRGDKADLDEARKLAERAYAATPTDAGVVGTVAMLRARQGDRVAAIARFREALRLDPDNVEAMLGLAEVLAAEPEKTRADASRAEAREWLGKARARLQGPGHRLPELRKQLDAVTASVAG